MSAATHEPCLTNPGIVACVEAERALLSCVLALPYPDALELVESLEAQDFTDPRLQDVLASSRRILAGGERPDAITVLGDLQREGLAPAFSANREAGSYLVDLAAAAPSVGSGGHYRRIVVETAWRRRVQEAGGRLQQIAGASALADVEQVLASEVVALRAFSLRWRSSYDAPPAVPLAVAG